jgi:DNA-binding response OmpR family regulator
LLSIGARRCDGSISICARRRPTQSADRHIKKLREKIAEVRPERERIDSVCGRGCMPE